MMYLCRIKLEEKPHEVVSPKEFLIDCVNQDENVCVSETLLINTEPLTEAIKEYSSDNGDPLVIMMKRLEDKMNLNMRIEEKVMTESAVRKDM